MGQRANLPKGKRERVLKEYNNKCAICMDDCKEVHHIDHNPNNNEVDNLLPLCSNCHTDVHNPLEGKSVDLLKLLRKYKLHMVLDPKFKPILNRMGFLLQDIQNSDSEYLQKEYIDLIEFIETFEKGKHYREKIEKLLFFPKEFCCAVVESRDSIDDIFNDKSFNMFDDTPLSNSSSRKVQTIGNSVNDFKKMHKKNKVEIINLILEQLTYQNW